MTPMRQLASTLRRAVHRTTWLRAMQGRASRIARLRRMLPRHVCSPTTAIRHGGGWRFATAEECVLTLVVHTPGRTLDDLRAPIRVVVHASHLVDLERLRASLGNHALLEVEAT